MPEEDVIACGVKRGIENLDPYLLLNLFGFKGGDRVLHKFPFDVAWGSGTEPANSFRNDAFDLPSNESHVLLFCIFNILFEEATAGSSQSFNIDPNAQLNLNNVLRRTVFKIRHNNQDILESVPTTGNTYKEHQLIDLLVNPVISLAVMPDPVLPAQGICSFSSSGFFIIANQIGPGGKLQIGVARNRNNDAITNTNRFRISGEVYGIKKRG